MVIMHQSILSETSRAHRQAQYDLDTIHFIKGDIDEVAIMFPNEQYLNDWLRWAEETAGVEHFASVPRDYMINMMPEYIPGQEPSSARAWDFAVRFEFLRIPGALWRIEAMCVLEGVAPLHSAAMMASANFPAIIHVSLKAPDPHAYHLLCLEFQEDMGKHVHAFAKQAEYRNSYGQFTYYGDAPPYFKPRVNLRDV